MAVCFPQVLAYFLLEYSWTERVVLHCKMQPYYVSDALEEDIAFMLDVCDFCVMCEAPCKPCCEL